MNPALNCSLYPDTDFILIPGVNGVWDMERKTLLRPTSRACSFPTKWCSKHSQQKGLMHPVSFMSREWQRSMTRVVCCCCRCQKRFMFASQGTMLDSDLCEAPAREWVISIHTHKHNRASCRELSHSVMWAKITFPDRRTRKGREREPAFQSKNISGTPPYLSVFHPSGHQLALTIKYE